MTALTPPLAVAALVLCAAGLAKLRSPGPARDALIALGLPSSTVLVRSVALAELGLGALVLTVPRPVLTSILAALYLGFTALSLALARRSASCGCFGESTAPASAIQSAISAALATVAIAATIWPPQAPSANPVVLIGILAAAYAVVVAYTELPGAWGAWEGR